MGVCFEIVPLRLDVLYLLLDRVLCPGCYLALAHHASAVFVEVRKRVRAADFCVLWLESRGSKVCLGQAALSPSFAG